MGREHDARWYLEHLVSAPPAAGAAPARAPAPSPLHGLRLAGELERRLAAVAGRGPGLDAAAAGLAGLDPQALGFVLHWVDVLRRADRELALAFAARAEHAVARMGLEGTEAWLLAATRKFDDQGLGAALRVLAAVDAYAEAHARRRQGVAFDEVAGVLAALVTGLGGRPLRIAQDVGAWTDTETIHLPPLMALLPDPADNRRLYKAQAVFLWAQNVHGTWRAPLIDDVAALRPGDALDRFASAEAVRLEACIARELPGLHRELEALHRAAGGGPGLPPEWAALAPSLEAGDADARRSLAIAREHTRLAPLAPRCYHGLYRPAAVREVLRGRVEREQALLRAALARLAERAGGEGDRGPKPRNVSRQLTVSPVPGSDGRSGRQRYRLLVDGLPVALPAETEGLLVSVSQDLGSVPEVVAAAGGGEPYDPNERGGSGDGLTARWAVDHADAVRYPEWDFERQRYRPEYCALREYDVEPGDPGFVAETRERYRGALAALGRRFEAIVTGTRPLRREPRGDDLDIDALVEALVEQRRGREPSERLFTRLERAERDIAVMFMVDMSGSTRGWVNRAEREALVLLCEALERLGDRYAIWGFSGRTHKRCEVYRVKRFDEPYDEAVRARIAGIRPRGYTRMGAAIRHLGADLLRQEARTRLLITLSDGKPEDHHAYRGRYGIEDTRRALAELTRDGVHPYCVTIDRAGGDYLPYMYGPAQFTVIDDVRRLPLRFADIYRRLTT